jgi:hypothetical protein
VPRELREEWESNKPAQMSMSYIYAEAIVDEGLKRGRQRYRSVALGVAAQFEFTIAQIDVIGSWDRVGMVRKLREGEIIRHRPVWRPSLRYEDFLPRMVLDMRRSKNRKPSTFDVTEYPLFMRALATVPETERHGPVAIDDAGYPIKRRYYNELYRELPNAPGVRAPFGT